ncbi:hypothetical protein PV04_00228 [Phialophora macrospora]|uniref:Uncharacterized protein n=1 Tax=Phialophora macrospora TaxID=1851006 RepID=A0A0D2GI67_9EURO|nr:hypothetical protein PV04_00228 [Phialophora macrospora]
MYVGKHNAKFTKLIPRNLSNRLGRFSTDFARTSGSVYKIWRQLRSTGNRLIIMSWLLTVLHVISPVVEDQIGSFTSRSEMHGYRSIDIGLLMTSLMVGNNWRLLSGTKHTAQITSHTRLALQVGRFPNPTYSALANQDPCVWSL